jgi:hypothetical protein
MRFIPFPLYILVSSCKLIPVLLVGVLVNRGIARGPQDFFSALIMTQGVLLYSGAKALEGGVAATGKHARVDSFLGVPVGEAAAVALGVGLTLTNLFLEGFTNAWQDRLNKRHRDAGRGGVPALQLMLDMNWLNFLALAVALGAEWAWRGPASYLGEAAAFAGRHPEVVTHMCAFSVTGAVAQVFIFGCLGACCRAAGRGQAPPPPLTRICACGARRPFTQTRKPPYPRRNVRRLYHHNHLHHAEDHERAGERRFPRPQGGLC